MPLEVISENMNYHNSNSYVSCESEFDSVSVPLARKVEADVYVIDSDKLEEAMELERTVTRLCGISEESWDYSGVFYTNCFRVNKPIMLTSLGFFGPASPSQGPVAYTVDILVEELRQTMPFVHGRSMSLKVNVSTRDSILSANFPKPVNILANVWYTIKFQLQGPETLRGVCQLDRVVCKGGVTFEFFQGSLQMPTLRYIEHSSCILK